MGNMVKILLHLAIEMFPNTSQARQNLSMTSPHSLVRKYFRVCPYSSTYFMNTACTLCNDSIIIQSNSLNKILLAIFRKGMLYNYRLDNLV